MLVAALVKQFFQSVGTVCRETGQVLDRVGSRMTDDVAYLERYSRHRKLYPLHEIWPSHGRSFIAPNASLVGEVQVGNNCAIWYGAVLKADKYAIRVHDNVFIGENSAINVTLDNPLGIPNSVTIASNVVIGEGCSLISCIIDSYVVIGKGSSIQTGAKIERGAILLPGTTVSPGFTIPSFSVWQGSPAKYVRDLSEEDFKTIESALSRESDNANRHFELLESLGHNLTSINSPK